MLGVVVWLCTGLLNGLPPCPVCCTHALPACRVDSLLSGCPDGQANQQMRDGPACMDICAFYGACNPRLLVPHCVFLVCEHASCCFSSPPGCCLQGFSGEQISCQRFLNLRWGGATFAMPACPNHAGGAAAVQGGPQTMHCEHGPGTPACVSCRYEGTDVPVMTPAPSDGDYATAFEEAYQVGAQKLAAVHTGALELLERRF